eukprot:6029841-Alexandrium_andersonii.AAC.1
MGPVTAPSIGLGRGLPQGAPASPLTFVLVAELVLRPLFATWRHRRSGWIMELLPLDAGLLR